MKRIAILLALAVAGGCSRDDGAPSPADQRELDAAEAMLNEAPVDSSASANAAMTNR
ncbi:hypothetical protein [Sphingomonas sp.]|uniref:hypothetical protein n=1 Tax=Sphingomonas sp. TaxID=28214 RepID=UPI00286D8F40|nr:hypothetical protein [Sphingomonas sp.]